MTQPRQLIDGSFLSGLLLSSSVRQAAGIVILSSAVLMSSVAAFGFLMSAPARAVIGDAPPDLHAEPVSISSKSGATLGGWFVAGRPGTGAVVLMHGVRSDRLSMVARSRWLNAAGLSVLLFDFQDHVWPSGEPRREGRS